MSDAQTLAATTARPINPDATVPFKGKDILALVEALTIARDAIKKYEQPVYQGGQMPSEIIDHQCKVMMDKYAQAPLISAPARLKDTPA